jgi:hypothetical protein
MDLTEIHKIRDFITSLRDDNPNAGYSTAALFYELSHTTRHRSNINPPFTTRERDYTNQNGLQFVSARKLFIEFNDPTGYTFAMEVLGSWKHFQMLEEGKTTGPLIKEWKEELDAKLHAEEIQHLRALAEGEGSTAYNAAKYLANKEYKPKAEKGRPKKEDIQKAAKAELKLSGDIKGDLERAGIKVN